VVVKSVVHEMRDDLACEDEDGQILQSQTLEEKQYVSMYLVFKSTIFYPPDDAGRGGYEPLAYKLFHLTTHHVLAAAIPLHTATTQHN
jgi:hypothetical protein